MKKYILLIASLVLSNMGLAQQPFFFSQYHETAPTINPAFTGIENFLDVKLMHRNQWGGFEGAPTTNYLGAFGNIQQEQTQNFKNYSLRISHPEIYDSIATTAITIKEKLRHGIGGYMVYETFGPFSQFLTKVNYSAHLPVGDKHSVAAGASLGVNNARLDLNEISLNDPDNDAYYQRLISQGGSTTSIVFDIGAMIYNDNYFAGYSIRDALNVVVSDGGLTDNLSQLTHNLLAGYQLSLNGNLDLQGSAFFSYTNSDFNQLDANVKLKLRRKGYVGVSYRTTKEMVAMAGFYFQNKFRLGYSYDMRVSGTNDINGNSHEITLGLMLFKKDLDAPYVW